MSELSEDPIVSAEKKGLRVVTPATNELFVDIDSTEDYEYLQRMLEVLRKCNLAIRVLRETPSQTYGHRHVVLQIDPPDPYRLNTWPISALDPTTRTALQACLGSDRKRELLTIVRILRKIRDEPTCFFETQETVDEFHLTPAGTSPPCSKDPR